MPAKFEPADKGSAKVEAAQFEPESAGSGAADADLGLTLPEGFAVTRFAVEDAATLATGIAGVVAAFLLSVPDRSRSWLWLPFPFLLLWAGASGIQSASLCVEALPSLSGKGELNRR